MIKAHHRIEIRHIHLGFSEVVEDKNYADSHRPLVPFGLRWGRGILIQGDNYLEAVTGSYESSHSQLKQDLYKNETTGGAFYYGYEIQTQTLYLEYASDCTFDFHDNNVLKAIIDSLSQGSGAFRDLIINKDHP